jgi:hypothetical protein
MTDEKCRECKEIKLLNPEHPICNFHQGVCAERKRIRKLIDDEVKRWGTGCTEEIEEAIKMCVKSLRQKIKEQEE